MYKQHTKKSKKIQNRPNWKPKSRLDHNSPILLHIKLPKAIPIFYFVQTGHIFSMAFALAYVLYFLWCHNEVNEKVERLPNVAF